MGKNFVEISTFTSIKKLIVIQGPTASGKTALAIELAKHFQTVIVSADSRQFYKEMSIGTAKPNIEEQAGIKHYFIDSHSIQKPLTAADYEKEALEVLKAEFLQHDYIILVGGSGMFIDALCKGLDPIPSNIELRDELTNEFKLSGLENLCRELKEKDPEYFSQVDQKNPARIIRAIEAIRLSGKTYSELRTKKPAQREFESFSFVIDLPREVLYNRINQRVEIMFDKGLLEEAQKLIPYQDLQSLNTVGYSELFSYFKGEIDLETAKEQIKQNSRRYAKRQLTWFKRDEKAQWLKSSNLIDQMKEVLRKMDEI